MMNTFLKKTSSLAALALLTGALLAADIPLPGNRDAHVPYLGPPCCRELPALTQAARPGQYITLHSTYLVTRHMMPTLHLSPPLFFEALEVAPGALITEASQAPSITGQHTALLSGTIVRGIIHSESMLDMSPGKVENLPVIIDHELFLFMSQTPIDAIPPSNQ